MTSGKKSAFLGVWDRTLSRKRRQTSGKVQKQCVGKNDRFRTVLGSMVDHTVPKRSLCFDFFFISCVLCISPVFFYHI